MQGFDCFRDTSYAETGIKNYLMRAYELPVVPACFLSWPQRRSAIAKDGKRQALKTEFASRSVRRTCSFEPSKHRDPLMQYILGIVTEVVPAQTPISQT